MIIIACICMRLKKNATISSSCSSTILFIKPPWLCVSVYCLQLVLPQCLQALPVYINSLRKSEVLLPGLRTSVHQRLQQRCQVLAMDARRTSTHFYPQLLPLVSHSAEAQGQGHILKNGLYSFLL